jgi:hypothetical protein
MYGQIRNAMAQFQAHRKGLFLTNTHHAYKGLRTKDGPFFWNAATFFHQWHRGRAYSIRIHGIFVEPVRDPGDPSSIGFKYVRIARGLWDSAFRATGDKPVAFSLQGNAFGKEPYTGNDEPDALPNQTMYDVFDAVIFLAPLERQRQSAVAISIYTPEFLRELKRRFGLMFTGAELGQVYKKSGTKNLDEFFALIEKDLTAPRPARPLDHVQDLGPIDEWKSGLKK